MIHDERGWFAQSVRRRWAGVLVAAICATSAEAQQVPSRPPIKGQPSPLQTVRQPVVPKIAGLPLDSARRTLERAKLKWELVPRGVSPADTDRVAHQKPEPGQPRPRDGVVLVVPVMPNVLGQTVERAERILRSRGIAIVRERKREVFGTASGLIIEQAPSAGEPIPSTLTDDVTVTIEMVRVPDVNRRIVQDAESRIRSARLVPRIEPQVTSTAQPNTVLGQDPLPRTPVKVESTVRLFVAQAPPLVTVPDVVGKDTLTAAAILAKWSLKRGRVAADDDANVPFGVVVKQSPAAGQPADRGTLVSLTVRSNRVRVPDLKTLTEADAKQHILNARLNLGSIELRDDASAPGTVIDQAPPRGTPVELGASVNITIARVPAQRMPDLTNRRVDVASSAARKLGLILDPIRTSRTEIKPDTVVAQLPSANSPIRRGDRVQLTVGAQIARVRVPNVIGHPVDEARRILDSARLRVGPMRGVPSPTTSGRVSSQKPSEGEGLPAGQAVALDTTFLKLEIVSIAVIPSAARIDAGDTLRLRATATMSDGTTRSISTNWSGRGGSIARDGFFTAGSDSGTYEVMATAPGGGPRGVARVTVVPRQVPPVRADSFATVPGVVGLPLTTAQSLAGAAGLTVVVAAGQSPRDDDRVRRQSPSAGTRIARGSSIEVGFGGLFPRGLWVVLAAIVIVVASAAPKAIKWIKQLFAPPPPITYSPGARESTFTIDHEGSRQGLELALALHADPGVQQIDVSQPDPA